MDFKTMKHLLAVILYCLSREQVLCDSPSESERYMNISNIDFLAQILSDKVLLVVKKYLDKNSFVSMFLLLKEDDYLMFELMVKTNQKMNSFWTLLTNDNFHSKYKYGKTNLMTGFYRPDVYIMPFDERDVFILEARLEYLIKQYSFNPRAKFIFLQLTNECG